MKKLKNIMYVIIGKIKGIKSKYIEKRKRNVKGKFSSLNKIGNKINISNLQSNN